MIYKRIPYCPVTKTPAIIRSPCILSESDPNWRTYKEYITGCEILADDVYSLCAGRVLEVVKEDTFYTVCVQYDTNTIVIYAHLKLVEIHEGDLIHTSDLVGSTDMFVRVEVATLNSPNVQFPFRIGSMTYYRDNPESLVDGTRVLSDSGSVVYMSVDDILNLKIHPYLITTSRSTGSVDYKQLVELGVVGVAIEAGYLYDEVHNKLRSFKNPKLEQQVREAVSAGVPFGLYTYVRSRSVSEAREELKHLRLIVRQYPPKLGMWLRLDLRGFVLYDDVIIDLYQEQLTDLGLSGYMGFYVTREQLKRIDWEKYQNDWHLWLIDHTPRVVDPIIDIDSSFFSP